MSEPTKAEDALMAERHDDGDGRNATWHMSVNRMGSMLATVRTQAAEAERRRWAGPVADLLRYGEAHDYRTSTWWATVEKLRDLIEPQS